MEIKDIKLMRAAMLQQYLELTTQKDIVEKRIVEVKGIIKYLDQTIKGISNSP